MNDSTWAITAYFNPVGYHRRKENYHLFRQHLPVPLVTVEHGYGDAFDLEDGDADQLIRVSGGDVLWQKERLLNIALEALPSSCRNVLWLDCDIVYPDRDWAARIDALLDRYRLLQLFRRARHLHREAAVQPLSDASVKYEADSFVWKKEHGALPEETFRVRGASQRLDYSPGFAWAARRDLLEEVGLYDAMILGGGDKAIAAAAYGYIGETVEAYEMTAPQERHYREWAEPFFRRVSGHVGYLDESMLHLWHGDLKGRGYPGRYDGFHKLAFDPYVDIKRNADECWCWASAKPELHRFVERYFETRKEDGE